MDYLFALHILLYLQFQSCLEANAQPDLTAFFHAATPLASQLGISTSERQRHSASAVPQMLNWRG
jgi:hypothetical protein